MMINQLIAKKLIAHSLELRALKLLAIDSQLSACDQRCV